MNRLAGASSPYLRQHADNPVDWLPWGDEALELARRLDRPLFVSIGYASCHWCHVMAHESFEDPATAEDLRRSFVSVKVDREERPDIDALYMAAVQAATGSGGWPMSVFCAPDGRPFFAGTYFPPSDRHGMPAFRRVLDAVATAWAERRREVESQADELARAVASEVRFVDRMAGARPGPTAVPAEAEVTGRLVGQLSERFDRRWGGFGGAPKFPRPALVELCLLAHRSTPGGPGRAMAVTTLDAMAAGGIYDHLAGGFARYSTDERWLVPHFEKMLTDQAQLARAYLHAWQETAGEDYRQVAAETIDYVLEALTSPSGALCASEDADAAGVEGGHATWKPAEVRAALDAAGLGGSTEAVCKWYGVSAEGNWEGATVLSRPPGAPLHRPEDIEAARAALLAARLRRPQPARDDKVLTEWNAMFVAVLAEAAGACDDGRWAARAEGIAETLFATNRRADGRWLRAAGSTVAAFAADYAWVVEACTRLGELTGRAVWTERAAAAAGDLLDLFWDDGVGGLFTAGRDAERLIVRGKDVLDGAVPSTNSVGALALLRLAALTGDERWRAAGERLVALAAPLLDDQPLAVADLVAALGLVEGAGQVVVAGERPDLLAAVRRHWLPGAVVAWGEPAAPALWTGREPGSAYVCRQFVCQLPAHDVATLEDQLADLGVGLRR